MSDFATSAERTARKTHRCCECRGSITPGTRYRRGVSIVDGRADTWRMCLPCNALSEAAWEIMRRENILPEDGPRRGELAAWLAE